MVWADLRDRYGITQLIFDGERSSKEIMEIAKSLGREYVVQVKGTELKELPKTRTSLPGTWKYWSQRSRYSTNPWFPPSPLKTGPMEAKISG